MYPLKIHSCNHSHSSLKHFLKKQETGQGCIKAKAWLFHSIVVDTYLVNINIEGGGTENLKSIPTIGPEL